MRRRGIIAGAGLAALVAPGVLLASSSGQTPPYELPTPTATPAPAVAPTPPPVPELGRAVVIERVSGRVSFSRKAHHRLSPLTAPTRVPVGAEVDALHGRVRLTVARDRRGHVWRSLFFDGRFLIHQARVTGAITQLELTGGSFKGCATASAARVNKRRHRRVRRLWGDGHGRFQTVGRYSAATVRGTRWEVEDRCDGTITRVARGVVTVTDYTTPPVSPVTGGGGGGGGGAVPAPVRAPGPRQVRVSKGHTYVARPKG